LVLGTGNLALAIWSLVLGTWYLVLGTFRKNLKTNFSVEKLFKYGVVGGWPGVVGGWPSGVQGWLAGCLGGTGVLGWWAFVSHSLLDCLLDCHLAFLLDCLDMVLSTWQLHSLLLFLDAKAMTSWSQWRVGLVVFGGCLGCWGGVVGGW